jgi:hypothetical protein
MKLRGLVPNFRIHVSVSDLYIPTIGPPILLQYNKQAHRSWENLLTPTFCMPIFSGFEYSTTFSVLER